MAKSLSIEKISVFGHLHQPIDHIEIVLVIQIQRIDHDDRKLVYLSDPGLLVRSMCLVSLTNKLRHQV